MTFSKKTIRDIPIEGATVLVRVDYNVPLDGSGKISDDLRIRASLATLEYLIQKKCKIILMSHLGRPDGSHRAALSLRTVAQHVAYLLKKPVTFVNEVTGDKAKQVAKRLRPGEVMMLENLRFEAGETANDSALAKRIVASVKPDYFIQDGFGVVHRAHASTDAIAKLVPGVAGLTLEREMVTISDALESPARPLVAIMGGAKVSDKIAVIERFVKTCDQILIGGAMANTFLAQQGHAVGKSKVETDQATTISKIHTAISQKTAAKDYLVLPDDVAVGRTVEPGQVRREVSVDAIEPDDLALDIAHHTIKRYTEIISQAGTVIWNGTLGLSEVVPFDEGSAQVAKAIIANPRLTSIIGGGDTAEFVRHWDKKGGASFSHVSTGGGAALDLMAGQPLPGVDALLDARR